MAVTTSVGAVCEITSTELAFGAFANSGSVANSSSGGVISTNCSTALAHVLKVTESSVSGVYTMITGDGVAPEKKITFKLYTAANATGTQLSEAVAFATATGTASTVAVSTIFGQISASQTGKEAGSYTKSIALSVTYGS
jgi:spore coat protein U-like protein